LTDNSCALKTALGISSRSLAHHWRKAGAPGQLPGYATHVKATRRATKYMKMGGYIGMGIGDVICVPALVGAAAWAGTTYGGMGGEIGGNILYERTLP